MCVFYFLFFDDNFSAVIFSPTGLWSPGVNQTYLPTGLLILSPILPAPAGCQKPREDQCRLPLDIYMLVERSQNM